MSLHVVLVHPEIHWNTGNAGRTCLAVGATLHLIEPLGFSLDEKQVRRAGLDYWEHVPLKTWRSWEQFAEGLPALGTPWFFDEAAPTTYWDAPLGVDDDVVLVFGKEKGGFPASLKAAYADRLLSIPIESSTVRSLNLSTSVALAAYEVVRQRQALGSKPISL
jgi:tRNA (cytidine/uridine-2'-O-)-methyltransferase